MAYRRLARPSSPLIAKASTAYTYSINSPSHANQVQDLHPKLNKLEKLTLLKVVYVLFLNAYIRTSFLLFE